MFRARTPLSTGWRGRGAPARVRQEPRAPARIGSNGAGTVNQGGEPCHGRTTLRGYNASDEANVTEGDEALRAVRVRRRGALGALALAVTLAVLAPAEAVTATSLAPIRSWGTGTSGGKAKKVLAIAEQGGTVYFGGEFTNTVRGSSSVRRNRLAAVDRNGDLVAWNPNASGPVRAMVAAADGAHVYVGGDFSRIGGVSAPKVARIRLADGRVDASFRASVNGRVRALALHGDRLYIGGDFHSVQGVARPQLAALDAGTGRLDPGFVPPANGGGTFTGQTGVRSAQGDGAVYAVGVGNDGTVHAAGSFTNFGGRSGLVSLDAAGSAVRVQFTVDRPVFGLAMWPADGRRVFAAAGGPGGRLFAFDPGKASPRWRAKVDGDAVGVAASETTAYLMGHYDNIVDPGSSCYQVCPGGPRRRHLAAFNAADGVLDPWNPVANTSTGPYTATAGRDFLYIGGAFTKINGVSQPGLAMFPGQP